MDIRTKYAELESLRAKANALVEKGLTENRSLSTDEQAEFDTLNAQVKALRDNIAKFEELAGVAPKNERSKAPAGITSDKTVDNKPTWKTEEYRSVADRYFRYGKAGLDADELRTLDSSSGSNGSYLLPEEYDTAVKAKLVEVNKLRNYCKTIQTASDKNIAVVTDVGDAMFIGEKASIPDGNDSDYINDPTFGRVTLKAYAMKKLVRVTQEQVQDSFADMGAILSDCFGKAFGRREARACFAGTGELEPTGLITAAVEAGQVVDTASVGTFNFDDIIDAEQTVPEEYRTNSIWVMSPDSVKIARKTKDTNSGRYIWNDPVAGQPATLNGHIVIESRYIPATVAGVFFNPEAFLIADRGARSVQVLVEKYADTGEIGYLCWQRFDCALLEPEASIVLTFKESST